MYFCSYQFFYIKILPFLLSPNLISLFSSKITRSFRRSSISKRSKSLLTEQIDNSISCVSDFTPNLAELDKKELLTEGPLKGVSILLNKDNMTSDVTVKNINQVLKCEEIKTTKEVSVESSLPENHKSKDEPKTFELSLSEQLYDGMKAAWDYGCGIPVVKPFFKMSKGVVVKILNLVTGIDLEKGDEEIKPKLATIDKNF